MVRSALKQALAADTEFRHPAMVFIWSRPGPEVARQIRARTDGSPPLIAVTGQLLRDCVRTAELRDRQHPIVAADDGWLLLGGYTLNVVELAGADGAVLGQVALP